MLNKETCSFDTLERGGDFDIYFLHSRKYKTVTIKAFILGRLDRDVEEEAILPFVLKRGSKKYPTLAKISCKLESLFGTKLSLDTLKLGERQIFVTALDMVNDRLLPGGEGLLEDGVGVLNDVLTNPRAENGSFPEDNFTSEKRNLERLIRSQIDDKGVYANIRLVEEMFKGEPFGKFQWGEAEKVALLDSARTWSFFKELLASAPAVMYVVGDVERDKARELASTIFDGVARRVIRSDPSAGTRTQGDGEVIEEEQPLEQSKLVMGYNVERDCDDDLYYALFFYNSILGGGSFSKLFKNVREKESLAYYVHSVYDKIKGFLRIGAGIHRDNRDRVLEIVAEQMDDIAKGRILDEEFSNARKALLSGLQGVQDSPSQLIDYHLVNSLSGRETGLDTIMNKLKNVNPDHVVAAARLVSPGKTFFLKGTAG